MRFYFAVFVNILQKYFKRVCKKSRLLLCGAAATARETLAICLKKCYNTVMENYLEALDEFFCAQYSDYVRISAIEGYEMPDVVYIADDGNVARRDSSCMRLAYQKNKAAVLATLKASLADTSFTFSYSLIPLREKLRNPFQKYTFAKLLPEALRHAGETVESAGEKLAIEPKFWNMIVKGKVYPEKNTVLALALVCRLQIQDINNLFAACGFSFDEADVRDVVVQFLIGQQIYNPIMRDKCLAEYKIENLPIKR
jgi:hypothetical protein